MTQKKRLLLSLLFGGLAAAALIAYIKSYESELLEMSSTTKVVVAKKDILEHRQIDETMLILKEVPKKYIQPGALYRLEDAIGQVTASPVLKEEQLVRTKLMRFGRETGLSMKIPSGMRAISVVVNDATGVAGLIQPDDFIDILGTFDFGDQSKSRQYTYTLFQNIRVLAVRQDLGEATMALAGQEGGDEKLAQLLNKGSSGGAGQTLTLAVTPSQAQEIILAQETGVLTVTLRGLWEADQVLDLEPATPATLTGLKILMRQNVRPRYREYRGRR